MNPILTHKERILPIPRYFLHSKLTSREGLIRPTKHFPSTSAMHNITILDSKCSYTCLINLVIILRIKIRRKVNEVNYKTHKCFRYCRTPLFLYNNYLHPLRKHPKAPSENSYVPRTIIVASRTLI